MSSRKKPAAGDPPKKRAPMRPPLHPEMRPPMHVTSLLDPAWLEAERKALLPQASQADVEALGKIALQELRLEMGTQLSQLRGKLASAETLLRRENDRDSVILGIEYFVDLLLPPSRASDAPLNLEEVYDRRWLPKYGARAARFIFAVQAVGVIGSTHGQRLTKWLGGALGLMKLYGWLSGPRGG
jgi:hypothetical protein